MNGIKRKVIAFATLVAMLCSFTLTGCKEKRTADGKYAAQMNIIVWDAMYSEQVFEDFQKKYGIHVNVTYINNTDELLTKMLNGKADYDVVDVESAYIEAFVKNDLLQKLDMSKIPNKKNFLPSVLGVVGDEKNQYTLPCFGKEYTCVIYNTETCPIEITKFSDLANPKLKNQVCMVNSTISLFGMALESLGYKASTSSEKEIKEAAELLKKIKKNVKTFVGSSGENQMLTGECSVGFLFDYPLLMSNPKNWDKFKVANLESGAESYMENLAIPKESKNVEEAHLLINYLSDKKVHATSVAEWGDIPAMNCAEYLPKGYMESPAFHLPDSFVSKLWMAPVNDKQITLMDQYYTEFMSSK